MEIKYLEVLEMPNGELLSAGKSLGFKDSICGESWSGKPQSLGDFLKTKEELLEIKELKDEERNFQYIRWTEL